MSKKYFCGIDGGASSSRITVLDDKGDILSYVEGPPSNCWLSEDTTKLLAEMAQDAKSKANLPKNTVFDGLGMCLSGCENEHENKEFAEKFVKDYPSLTKNCIVASDTVSPLCTASSHGGLVLIAGTGSNSLLVNPDGSTGRCGGWGHLIGDEGSAMWISMKAVKTIFDDEDNLEKCPYSINKVKELMLQYFNIEDKYGMLKHCYTEFNKTFFAGFCLKLSESAVADKDPLCCHLFYEAGKILAKMVIAIKSHAHKELLESDCGLPIICVGSVFKSWNLLEKGFTDTMSGHYKNYTLMRLKVSASIGAAVLGAKSAGQKLPIDLSKNVSILYSHLKK